MNYGQVNVSVVNGSVAGEYSVSPCGVATDCSFGNGHPKGSPCMRVVGQRAQYLEDALPHVGRQHSSHASLDLFQIGDGLPHPHHGCTGVESLPTSKV